MIFQFFICKAAEATQLTLHEKQTSILENFEHLRKSYFHTWILSRQNIHPWATPTQEEKEAYKIDDDLERQCEKFHSYLLQENKELCDEYTPLHRRVFEGQSANMRTGTSCQEWKIDKLSKELRQEVEQFQIKDLDFSIRYQAFRATFTKSKTFPEQTIEHPILKFTQEGRALINQYFESVDFVKMKQTYKELGHILGKCFSEKNLPLHELAKESKKIFSFWEGIFSGSVFPGWTFWYGAKFSFKYAIHEYKLKDVLIGERNKLWSNICSLYETFFNALIENCALEQKEKLQQDFAKHYRYAYKDAATVMNTQLYVTI